MTFAGNARRVDFRDLVSDMFALYKTRIWMAQVDMASAALDIGESISMAAGFLPLPSERLPDPMAMMSSSPFSSPIKKQPSALTYPSPPGAMLYKDFKNQTTTLLDEKSESELNFGEGLWDFH